MSMDTLSAEDMIMNGDVSIAFDDQTVQSVFDDGTPENKFALGHVFTEPGCMRLYFNERNVKTGEVATRVFKFQPHQLIEAITKTILIAKNQKEDSFI